MPFDLMESFSAIHKPCSFSSHAACKATTEHYWKSTVKIMLNVSFGLGINNLWCQKSCSVRRHGNPLWSCVVITILLLLVLSANAYPALSSVHHHQRNYLPSSIGNSGNAPQKVNYIDENGSADATLSLSIFSPLDILRQNMILEINRKRRRHLKQRQMQSNKEFLERIG